MMARWEDDARRRDLFDEDPSAGARMLGNLVLFSVGATMVIVGVLFIVLVLL